MHNLAEALAFFLLNQPVAAWAVDINRSKQTAKPCNPADCPPMGSGRLFGLLNEQTHFGDDSIRSTSSHVKRVRVSAPTPMASDRSELAPASRVWEVAHGRPLGTAYGMAASGRIKPADKPRGSVALV